MKQVGVAVAALGLLAGPVASAQGAEPRTPVQQKAYAALVAKGVDGAKAAAAVKDPAVVAATPVEFGGDSSSGVNPTTTTTKDGAGTQRIGTCSGKSTWVQRNQWIKNVYGTKLMEVVVRTTFYYNGSRVTCASSTNNKYVATLAAAGGWAWVDKEFSEGFYTYNGRSLGGVKTEASHNFQQCVVKVGCFNAATITARTYGHYDGSSSNSGHSSGG
ncbi:hypothetical protein KMZ32_01890 [Phycicoccus sp. MAQZ13P-2]|uniref:hypothetical protein n=1 Tax=Phycicoccus mangrovi TaxID=2840470 RepID=UPI001C00658C|nr:hypothetical protein [Phycicoccus mangrovi]MBT9254444.1 hypothetical protein [Phycicoccus mangrovi]MBT9272822.1 hypothetical protein [Phycicoccus mangrovi]